MHRKHRLASPSKAYSLLDLPRIATETSCFRACGLNPDNTRFPDFDIYLDEISEMLYVKTVVLDFSEQQVESLATVAPEIGDALDKFFTEHQTPSKPNHCFGGCFSMLLFMIRRETV